MAVGLIGLLVLLLATQSFNVPYLWPLLPWDGEALWDVFLRRPVPVKRFRPRPLHPQDPDRLPPPEPKQ